MKEFNFIFGRLLNSYRMLDLLENANICNPNVERLVVRDIPVGLDFEVLAQCFPNVNHMKINHKWAEYRFTSCRHLESAFYVLNSLDSMENVTKLDLNYAHEYMLRQIEMKALRELTIFEYYTDHSSIYSDFEISKKPMAGFRSIDIETFDVENYADTINWMIFVKKNQQLESLHIYHVLQDEPYQMLSCVHLEIMLTKLPNLKSLEVERIQIYDIVMERIADVIGRNYDRFEHFEVEIDTYNLAEFDRFETRLQQLYPNVKYQRDGTSINISK